MDCAPVTLTWRPRRSQGISVLAHVAKYRQTHTNWGAPVKYLHTILLSVICIGVTILAFKAIYGLLTSVPAGINVKTSYEDIVVVLLTTVTVIFTVAALVIGILAFLGPRALKREATKFAENAVQKSIEEAMKPDGLAAKLLEASFPPKDGPLKSWMEKRIDRQVISLLPLIIDRFNLKSDVGPVDPDAPDDEGNVN